MPKTQQRVARQLDYALHSAVCFARWTFLAHAVDPIANPSGNRKIVSRLQSGKTPFILNVPYPIQFLRMDIQCWLTIPRYRQSSACNPLLTVAGYAIRKR